MDFLGKRHPTQSGSVPVLSADKPARRLTAAPARVLAGSLALALAA